MRIAQILYRETAIVLKPWEISALIQATGMKRTPEPAGQLSKIK